MARSKFVGLTLAAVFALSAAASASAHEFVNSKEGTLAGKNLGVQHFNTSVGNAECATAKTSGKVKALKTKVQKVKVAYSECTAFGTFSAKISEAEFEFNAEGTVTVLNTITLEANGCVLTIGPTGNSGLKSVSYENKSGKLVAKSAITGVTYKASSTCNGGEKTGTDGEVSGSEESELVGGTVEWK